MAKIKITSKCELYDGMSITFKAPCDCTAVDGLNVHYQGETHYFSLRDAHGNDLAGVRNLFSAGTYVKVILDTASGIAYIQNADSNAYLEKRLEKIGDIRLSTRPDLGDTWTLANGDRVDDQFPELGRVVDPMFRRFPGRNVQSFGSKMVYGDGLYVYATVENTYDIMLHYSPDLVNWKTVKARTVSSYAPTVHGIAYHEGLQRWCVVYTRIARKTSNYSYYTLYTMYADDIASDWTLGGGSGVSEVQNGVTITCVKYVNGRVVIAVKQSFYNNGWLISSEDCVSWSKMDNYQTYNSTTYHNTYVRNILYKDGYYYFAAYWADNGYYPVYIKTSSLTDRTQLTPIRVEGSGAGISESFYLPNLVEANGKYYFSYYDGTNRKVRMSEDIEMPDSAKTLSTTHLVYGLAVAYVDGMYIMALPNSTSSNNTQWGVCDEFDGFTEADFKFASAGFPSGTAYTISFLDGAEPFFTSLDGALLPIARYLPTLTFDGAYAHIKAQED